MPIPLSILVIDDDRHDLSQYQQVLPKFELQAASSVTDACLNPRPALILLNYSLPGMNNDLRELTAASAIPVIALTGEPSEAVEALEIGAADYLLKDQQQQYLQLLPKVVERVLANAMLHARFSLNELSAQQPVEEARLRESEERFRGTLEQVAVGIAHASLDGHFQHINQKFCAIVGYSREELLQVRFQDITYPMDREKNTRYTEKLLSGEISYFSMEKRYLRKNRDLVWVNLTVSLLRDENGSPKYTIGVIEDITGRKQSEAMLQQFGGLLQGSFNEIYIIDAYTLHFLLTSAGAEENLGYSSEELNQLTILELMPAFTRESFLKQVAPLKTGLQTLQFFKSVHLRKNGSTYPIEARLQYMPSDFPVYVAIIQDITERDRTERQLRELTALIQSVREEEKARVAREIHDDLGGTLTALKMDVFWLARGLRPVKKLASLRERVDSMSDLLDNALAVMRRIITELRPTMLDDLGLIAALEWQAAQFQKRTGIECKLACSHDCETAHRQAINLFRIVQEALTNVTRHSVASRVEINFNQSKAGIFLSISDNGCGLPESQRVAANSYGIRSMSERAGQMGGKISFSQPTGGGLCLTVTLPYQEIP